MRTAILAPLLLFLSACSSLDGSPTEGALRADVSSIRAAVTAEEVRFTVPFTYRNTTGETVELHGCNRPNPPVLERQEGSAWVTAYMPAVNLCLAPPLRLSTNQVYTAELYVAAGRGSGRISPHWETPVAGMYRLHWTTGKGATAREVVSAPFEVTE